MKLARASFSFAMAEARTSSELAYAKASFARQGGADWTAVPCIVRRWGLPEKQPPGVSTPCAVRILSEGVGLGGWEPGLRGMDDLIKMNSRGDREGIKAFFVTARRVAGLWVASQGTTLDVLLKDGWKAVPLKNG